MQVNKKGLTKVGLMGGGLIFVYFLASYVVPKTLVTMTKAAPATKVSLTTSLVLGQKVLSAADGVDKNIVNVYLLDESGKGVSGKGVVLKGAESIKPSIKATDNDGKASFEITSKKEQQYKISASVDGVDLPKTVTVTFRN